MTYNTISIARRFQLPPFLLKEMATPHVPRGIAEGLPVNVIFVVDIERSDPMYLVVSQHKINSTRHALANENVAIIFFPASRLIFVPRLPFERVRPAELYGHNSIKNEGRAHHLL
jgi:hypothetical protein